MKKKDIILICQLILVVFVLIITNSCKKDKVPILTTSDINNIMSTTANCGGNIISDEGSTIIARGVCWSIGQTPTISDSKTIDGTGIGGFTSHISGLIPNTTFYVRAYATNSAGTGYGNSVSFRTTLTIETGTVADIDGNVYITVKIGNQWWMAENLKVIHYRNGDPVTNLTDSTEWSNLLHIYTEAYCDYNNIPSNSIIYGKLYDWYAVNDSRNLAPTGWHISTDAEWTTLTDYLGGASNADEKLKEIGTIHWQGTNIGATNETGFTALPGGGRDANGSFSSLRDGGFWWTSTEADLYSAWCRGMTYDNNEVGRGYMYKSYGFSVRCVKD
jgi:uncharacterized protein (TIGR02145 family)